MLRCALASAMPDVPPECWQANGGGAPAGGAAGGLWGEHGTERWVVVVVKGVMLLQLDGRLFFLRVRGGVRRSAGAW